MARSMRLAIGAQVARPTIDCRAESMVASAPAAPASAASDSVPIDSAAAVALWWSRHLIVGGHIADADLKAGGRGVDQREPLYSVPLAIRSISLIERADLV